MTIIHSLFLILLVLGGVVYNDYRKFLSAPTYLEIMAEKRFNVGDEITIDKGFYKGCKLKIEEIKLLSLLSYFGKSDCPIKGFNERGDTFR